MSLPVAIIAGASSGIGEAAARTLGNNGYRVVLAARRQERLEDLASQIREEGGEALPIQTDLAQVEQIQQLVEKTIQAYGKIDILVNSAGSARHVWFDEHSLISDIQIQIQANLTGAIQLTRTVLPWMLTENRGHIIHICSISSWVGVPTYSIYSASKFGLRGFLESLRRELRGTGITVSEIYPGAVDTEFGQHVDVQWKTPKFLPKWMLLSAEDVADQVLRVIQKKKKTTIIPGFMGLVIWANAHFPGIVSWVLSKAFYRKGGIRVTWLMSDD